MNQETRWLFVVLGGLSIFLILWAFGIDLYSDIRFGRADMPSVGGLLGGLLYGLFGVVVFVGLAVLYLLPSFYANSRKCVSLTGIVIVNLFLGWTGLGWVGALVWAASGQISAPTPGASSGPPQTTPTG